MGVKSTDAEVELRINQVYTMVVKGDSRKDIVRYGSKTWDVSSRTIDEYLAKVHEEIKETYNKEYKENIISKQLVQLDDLYKKNYTNEDFKECRSLIETKSKLLGLNEPEKRQVANDEHSIKIEIVDARTTG